MAKIKFYDMRARKSVYIDEDKTWVEIKGSGSRKVKMRVGYGAGGGKVYRIMGRA